MFSASAYENSQLDGVSILEIVTDEDPGVTQPRQFVPLKRTELRGEIVGPLAHLLLTQVYGYSREQSGKVLEALYRFPLPGDAAVTRVRVHFGDVEIQTELKEREQAEADYEEAKRQGRQAALTTRESPGVFTLQVAGIQPGQDVTVETTYVQLARTEGGAWSLRVPLTTVPRYVRSDEVTSRHAHAQPLLLLRDPGHRFSLDVTVRGAGSVESHTHPLDVTEEGHGMRVRLRDGEVVPDRDCVLSWRASQDQVRPTLQVLLHEDASSRQVYFLALVAPRSGHKPGRGVPREIILLVDHSGSMHGAKWEAADWAVEAFLSDLSERDAFALGLFHNTTRWFSGKLRRASTDAVGDAVRFLQMHKDSGGTELGVALEQALNIRRSRDQRARHVLIVTDAQVTDAGRVLRLASVEMKRKHRRRISVLCIDAAPNSFLASELAERSGGVARFLTSTPEAEDITTALDRVLEDWGEPVLADLRLSVSRADVQAARHRAVEADDAGWSIIDVGDLPSGRAVWVVGRVPRGDSSGLAFRVMTMDSQEIAACRLSFAKEMDTHPALKALFGARRVLALEYLINSGYTGQALWDQLARLGYDPGEVMASQSGKLPKVYAENVRADVQEALRGLLVREALDYGLASSETAFVAVRREVGKPVDGTVVVANALPMGWSDDFLPSLPLRASVASGVQSVLDVPSFIRRGMTKDAVRTRTVPVARFRAYREARSFLGDRDKDPSSSRTMEPVRLFLGVPNLADGDAVLFDSSREEDASKLPKLAAMRRLVVRFPDGTPDYRNVDRGLSLLIFVGDLSSPRARVRLADLVRRHGERPLNLLRRPGQVVRIVLLDPAGVWTQRAPQIDVALGWQTEGGLE
jgi:Ca-activated chloride channel family protein